MWPNLQETFFVQCVGQKRGKISQYFFSKDTRWGGGRHHVNFLDFFGSQTRLNVLIAILLRLNALFITYILPENTGPHCNYKIIGGTREEGWSLPSPPPVVTPLGYMYHLLMDEWMLPLEESSVEFSITETTKLKRPWSK